MKKFNFLKNSITECDNLCRLGGFRDGGYVLPYSAIKGSDTLISGGVGSTARFEIDAIDINPKINVIPIDYSFSVFRMFLRTAYHIFKSRNNWRFSLMENITAIILIKKHKIVKRWINSSYNLIDIEKEFNLKSKRLIIKLDIEGDEFKILDSILELENNINGLCVEFHRLDEEKNLLKLKNFINKTKLKLIYISVNEGSIVDNEPPKILELSFCNNLHLNNKLDYLQSSFSPGLEELVVL